MKKEPASKGQETEMTNDIYLIASYQISIK
jgi:hypothetical protein